MNIEIKFRGFSPDLNKWVYGSLHKPFDDVTQIIQRIPSNASQMTLVVNGSEGQFIGCKDLNGIDIFRGDIVIKKGKKYIIEYNYLHMSWGLYTKSGQSNEDIVCDICNKYGNAPIAWMCSSISVIGNSFENQELLQP